MTSDFSAAAMDAAGDGSIFPNVMETINFESGLLDPVKFNSNLRVKSRDFSDMQRFGKFATCKIP